MLDVRVAGVWWQLVQGPTITATTATSPVFRPVASEKMQHRTSKGHAPAAVAAAAAAAATAAQATSGCGRVRQQHQQKRHHDSSSSSSNSELSSRGAPFDPSQTPSHDSSMHQPRPASRPPRLPPLPAFRPRFKPPCPRTIPHQIGGAAACQFPPHTGGTATNWGILVRSWRN